MKSLFQKLCASNVHKIVQYPVNTASRNIQHLQNNLQFGILLPKCFLSNLYEAKCTNALLAQLNPPSTMFVIKSQKVCIVHVCKKQLMQFVIRVCVNMCHPSKY